MPPRRAVGSSPPPTRRSPRTPTSTPAADVAAPRSNPPALGRHWFLTRHGRVALYVPNLIGYARVAAVAAAFALAGSPVATVCLYVAAFACDELDGRFARKFDQTSTFGTPCSPWRWADGRTGEGVAACPLLTPRPSTRLRRCARHGDRPAVHRRPVRATGGATTTVGALLSGQARVCSRLQLLQQQQQPQAQQQAHQRRSRAVRCATAGG